MRAFRNRESLLEKGLTLTRRSRVEIRQHGYCFEEGQGNRVGCYGSQDRQTDSPSSMVCAKREGAVAATRYRHRFPVVQEHPQGPPSKDPFESTDPERQTSCDNPEKTG